MLAQLITNLTSAIRVSHHGAYSMPYVPNQERLYEQRPLDSHESEAQAGTGSGGTRVNLSLLTLRTNGSGFPGHTGRGAPAEENTLQLEKIHQRLTEAAHQFN
ncbi:MAG TPA: hypothetical protein V6C69_17670 [Trichormus sp.]|jgi:hypothetical protein